MSKLRPNFALFGPFKIREDDRRVKIKLRLRRNFRIGPYAVHLIGGLSVAAES